MYLFISIFHLFNVLYNFLSSKFWYFSSILLDLGYIILFDLLTHEVVGVFFVSPLENELDLLFMSLSFSVKLIIIIFSSNQRVHCSEDLKLVLFFTFYMLFLMSFGLCF